MVSAFRNPYNFIPGPNLVCHAQQYSTPNAQLLEYIQLDLSRRPQLFLTNHPSRRRKKLTLITIVFLSIWFRFSVIYNMHLTFDSDFWHKVIRIKHGFEKHHTKIKHEDMQFRRSILYIAVVLVTSTCTLTIMHFLNSHKRMVCKYCIVWKCLLFFHSFFLSFYQNTTEWNRLT